MKLEKDVEKRFDEIFPNLWDSDDPREGCAGDVTEEVKTFISQEIQTAVQKERAKLKEVFIDWAGDSQYVTGAWNDEEQEPYKEGEYWEQRARSAWGQLEYLLNKSTTKDTKDVV